MDKFDIYKDISRRTNGDIYVGVVGPVRTGKSTFIKRFMEEVVIDNIDDRNVKARAVDELPQSADGKLIMTSQPKFVPGEAVSVTFNENIRARIRMIDCVGYLVEGALGSEEDGKDRLVRTPWSDEEMPFEKAAERGTEKVISEHSTVAVLVTTDGTVTDFDRANYVDAEQRVVNELKEIGKPFIILLNTAYPDREETVNLVNALKARYDAPVIAKDALKLTAEDAGQVMEELLKQFPIKLIDVKTPRWLQALSDDSGILKELSKRAADSLKEVAKMRDYDKLGAMFENAEYFAPEAQISFDMGEGRITVQAEVKPEVYFKVLSEECGRNIADDFDLFSYIKKLRYAEKEYEKLHVALEQVKETGYGVVQPTLSEMLLEEPEMVKQGGQYGIKLRASAPSLHIMRVDVETEVNPIVGTEQQGQELVKSMLSEFESDKNGIWETNIFGRSLNSLVNEGLNNKLQAMPEEARNKMRKTLGKIVNEGHGGVICILL